MTDCHFFPVCKTVLFFERVSQSGQGRTWFPFATFSRFRLPLFPELIGSEGMRSARTDWLVIFSLAWLIFLIGAAVYIFFAW